MYVYISCDGQQGGVA